MKSSVLISNVKYILEEYGEHIKNDKQLVLLFWQQIDGVEMDKESISTVDFLTATSESDIIATKNLLDVMKGSEQK